MTSMMYAEDKFRKWLDEQPVGTKWTGRDVMSMMKGNKHTELVNVGAVRSLMARFKNVGYTRASTCSPAEYEKVAE